MQYQVLGTMGKEHVLSEVVVMCQSDAIDRRNSEQVGERAGYACRLAEPLALPEATQVENDSQHTGGCPRQ
ncbi:hypothetical protein HAL1_13053 [Halomonas sp. HAL1]|nr:hypothetical protein HAL1_13053 [Halomonas sp. HAL1]